MTDANEVLDSLDDNTKKYISKLSQEEFDEIIAKARDDSEKITEIDINNIIDIAEIPDNHYLENQTTDSILNDIHNVIIDNNIPNYEDIIKKIINYRYVDEIHEI